jgi:hypothetical protein
MWGSRRVERRNFGYVTLSRTKPSICRSTILTLSLRETQNDCRTLRLRASSVGMISVNKFNPRIDPLFISERRVNSAEGVCVIVEPRYTQRIPLRAHLPHCGGIYRVSD